MSGWNYRIIRHTKHMVPYLALHEVYYSEDGNPTGYTDDPISFVSDEEGEGGRASIVWMLETALEDAKTKPTLDDSEFDNDAS